jgi:tetratricopeptide (TPR) repeat protein
MRAAYSIVFCAAILAASRCATAQSAPANANDFLRSGVIAQQHRDYQTAIADYRKALELQPALLEARANLGASLAAIGQFDAAIAEDLRALQSSPRNTSLRMNLALAYYKKGDMANAHEQFSVVHQARPTDLNAVVLLGYTDLKLGKEMDAIQMLRPMEAGHESNTDLEYVLAAALIQSGGEAEGLPRMEKVALATQSAEAYFIAGSAHMRRQEFREARVDLDAALELNPSIPGLYTLAGQARDALGDTAASAPAFEAALRADPRDATANLYLGVIRLKARDLTSARPLLELALQLSPRWPLARLEVAKLNGMTGQYAEAAATLEDLEKTDPSWPDPHIELAVIYYKLHRPADGDRERVIVKQLEDQQQKAGPEKIIQH